MIGGHLNELVEVDRDYVVIAGVIEMRLQLVIPVETCIRIPKLLHDRKVAVVALDTRRAGAGRRAGLPQVLPVMVDVASISWRPLAVRRPGAGAAGCDGRGK